MSHTFSTILSPVEGTAVLEDWNRRSVSFETDTAVKGKIVRTEPGAVFLPSTVSDGEVTLNIQLPGVWYEIQGVVKGGRCNIDKFVKINRRETYRLTVDSFQKCQVAFTWNKQPYIGILEDISIEGAGFSSSLSLGEMKNDEIIKEMKILLGQREIVADVQIRRVFKGDKVAKVGAKFIKFHTSNAPGQILSFINVTLYNRKKTQGE